MFLARCNNKDWLNDFQEKPDEYVIRREYKHFDLCIFHKDTKLPVFILENKVKSIPTLVQLENYTKSLPQRSNCCRALLTLIDEFAEKDDIEKNGWIIVTYKELAHCLNNISFYQEPYIHYLINDYRLFINSLNEIKDNWVISDKYLLDKKTSEELSSIRIVDLAQKLQICRLYINLRKAIEEKNIACSCKYSSLFWEFKKHHMKIAVGYSNKSAILDIVLFLDKEVDINSKNDNINTLHIQLQGEQYRHAYEFEINNSQSDNLSKIELRTPQYNDEIKQISEKNQDLNKYKSWLCHSIKENNALFENSQIMPSVDNYNSYKGSGNGKYSLFIYQYKKIKKDAKITDIVDYILSDIKTLEDFF